MDTEQMQETLKTYRNLMFQIRLLAVEFSELLVGNLQRFKLNSYVLDKLKHELKNWDSTKHVWK